MTKWAISDDEMMLIKHGGGAVKERPGLDFIGKVIMGQK